MSGNTERGNENLLWTHGDIDLEQVYQLSLEDRAESLWQHTIDFLRSHNRYYSEVIPTPELALRDIAVLPSTSADALYGREADRYICSGTRADVVHWSGGTTSIPKRLEADMREERYLNAARALELQSTKRDPTARTIQLRVLNAHHGPYASIPSLVNHRVVPIPVYERSHYRALARVILDYADETSGEHITEIRGQDYYIKTIAAFLAEHYSHYELRIPSVLVGSNHISSRWYKRLGSVFDGTVRQIFGMTEFYQSYATQCSHCGDYHFLWTVYPEVVALGSDSPIASGIGELLLTHFVPFALRRPLLRYRTGDIAMRAGVCEKTGRDRFWLGGRLRDAILLSEAVESGPNGRKPEDVITGPDIKAAIEELEFVEHEADQWLGILHSDRRCTMPVFDYSFDAVTRRLTVKLVSADDIGGAKARAAAELIGSALTIPDDVSLNVRIHHDLPGGSWL